MVTTLKSLTREYRADKKKLENISKKINSLQMQITTIKNSASDISKEAQNKKVLIDFCIETGLSPIEAKLSYTLDEMKNEITHLYFSNYMTSDYTTGATGAIGNGSNHYTGLTGGTGGISISGTTYSTLGQGCTTITNPGNISVIGGSNQPIYKKRTP